MTHESMAQAIYDAAGTTFYATNTTPGAELTDFLAASQDASASTSTGRGALNVSAWYVEGHAKPLRKHLSAWLEFVFQLTIGGTSAAAGPIVVDPVGLLSKDLADGGEIDGGVNGGTGCIVGGGGCRVNGVQIAGAHWQVVHGGSSPLSLVDHNGAEITTRLVSGDRIDGSVSFLAVND